jgi:hypothetical protein
VGWRAERKNFFLCSIASFLWLFFAPHNCRRKVQRDNGVRGEKKRKKLEQKCLITMATFPGLEVKKKNDK